MNWKIILYNIQETREQLEQIEKLVAQGNPPSEVNFQIKLEHCYHHLNFAWNIRYASTEDYSKISDRNFNRWSEFPKVMKSYKLKYD